VVGRVAKVNVVHANVATQLLVGEGAIVVRVLPCPQARVLVGLDKLAGCSVALGVYERDIAFVLFRLLVNELEDAVGAGKAHDHGVDLHRNLADLAAELLGHIEERYHDGDG